jgi:branched-chain amino acid transport system substrate-binding protein
MTHFNLSAIVRSVAVAPLVAAGLSVAFAAGCGAPRQPVVIEIPRPVPPPQTWTADEADTDYATARALFDRNDFKAALEALRLFASRYPGDRRSDEVDLMVSRCQLATADAEGAREGLRQLSRTPVTEASAASYYLQYQRASEGDVDGALAALGEHTRQPEEQQKVVDSVFPADAPLALALIAEAQLRENNLAPALDALAALELRADAGPLATYATDRIRGALVLNTPPSAMLSVWNAASDTTRKRVGCELASLALASGDRTLATELSQRAETLTATSCGLVLTASAAAPTPTLGLLLTLSGPARRAGRALLGGALLAERSFDAEQPASKLLIRDTFSDAAAVTRAVDELAAAGAIAIVGPVEPELVEVARAAAVRHGLPHLALSPKPLLTHQPGSFRLFVDAAAEASRAIEAAVTRRGVRRIAIVTEKSSPDGAFLDLFRTAALREARQRGLEELVTVEVDTAPKNLQTSAAAAAAAIARTGADAVLFAATSTVVSAVVSNLAAKDIFPADGETHDRRRRVSYLLSSMAADDYLLRNAAAYLQGAIIPFWFLAPLATDEAALFRNRFLFHFGREPSGAEAFSHDAITLLRRAMLTDGLHSAAELRRRMDGDWSAQGVVGPIRFDANGNPKLRPRLATVKNGRFEALP